MNIAGIEIGDVNPCRFVAELSNAHNGDFDRALSLIDAAKAAGADFVKLQCYTPDELVALRGDGPAPEPWGAHGWTMRTLYEKARTPHEWFPYLFKYAGLQHIPIFSSVFGSESLALLESCGCPAYKIARLDNDQRDFIGTVVDTGKPVIVSGADNDPWVVGADLTLYCPPGYPQSSFGFERAVAECGSDGSFGCRDGFSFHGTDAFPCVVAATLGAKLIEAHLMLRDQPSELEANVSLDEYQFAAMVRDVRRMEAMVA